MTEVLDIRLPELTGGTEEEQLRQIRSYLYQLASQLQFAFDTVSREQEQQKPFPAQKTPAEVFTSIKSLIIKSADIVEKYSEETERRLAGVYVAQSQFGTYTQQTEQKIRENADGIRQSFANVQAVQSQVEGVRDQLTEVNAYIRTGLLYEDEAPVYGVEIGQQTEEDGIVRFRKFVRLSADRLAFFDGSGTEVAYISDYRLHVREAEVQYLTAEELAAGDIRMGEYLWTAGSDGHLTLC